MLTEADKNRIFLEESYRLEVKRLLGEKATKSKSERVWAHLNSAFTLWLLSAVLVSVVSSLYGNWQKQRDVERERSVIQRKLDGEIANRLSYVHSLTFQDGIVADPVAEALRALENPSESKYSISVFPEYANRSLRSLLWELTQVLPTDLPDEEKQRIETAYRRCRLFPVAFMTNFNTQTAKAARPEVVLTREMLYGALQTDFNLERWGKPIREANTSVIQEPATN